MPVPTNQNSRAAAAARMAAAKGKSATQFQKLKTQREERIEEGAKMHKRMGKMPMKKMPSAQGMKYGSM